MFIVAVSMLVGCAAQQGPTLEEMQARQDSIAQARQDSIEQAYQDSLAEVAERERERFQQMRQELQEQLRKENNAREGLKTVHFAFDKSALDDEARGKLQKNAETLMKYGDWKIVVEGHCDKRGSTEYNLALGERRANAVKEYYVDYGIGADRVEMISYGEERPLVADASTDEEFAKNRRGVTKVTGGVMTADEVPTIEELRQQEEQKKQQQEMEQEQSGEMMMQQEESGEMMMQESPSDTTSQE
jgi:peptidoglycan-associated lipoprotein